MGKPIVIMFHNRRILKNVGPLKNMLIIGGHPPICCKNVSEQVCVTIDINQIKVIKYRLIIGIPPILMVASPL